MAGFACPTSPSLWIARRCSVLALHRTRREAARDITLRHHQHYAGRHHGDGCRGHHRAPVGRIVAEIVVDPERDRLCAGAVEDRQGKYEVSPAGEKRENRDGYDSRAGEWNHDE